MIPAEIPEKRIVPLAGTFAAAYAILRLVPFFVMVGGERHLSGTTEFIDPLLGTMLVPYVGSRDRNHRNPLGHSVHRPDEPPWLDFWLAMMNALGLGPLKQKQKIPPAALYSALLILIAGRYTSL